GEKARRTRGKRQNNRAGEGSLARGREPRPHRCKRQIPKAPTDPPGFSCRSTYGGNGTRNAAHQYEPVQARGSAPVGCPAITVHARRSQSPVSGSATWILDGTGRIRKSSG